MRETERKLQREREIGAEIQTDTCSRIKGERSGEIDGGKLIMCVGFRYVDGWIEREIDVQR